MKKPILLKHTNVPIHYMENDLADEFDEIFETFLILLKLNHNLKPDIVNHDKHNATLYSRNMEGYSEFSMSIDILESVKSDESAIKIKIMTEIDLTSIESLSLNYDLDIYDLKSTYNDIELIDFMKELIKCL